MTPARRRFYEAARARWLRPGSDGLRRLADHVSATGALLRASDDGLAPGAAMVAAIVALRSAATASGSHAEFTGKWEALRSFGRIVRPSLRDRFVRVCEAGRAVEAQRRLVDGLPVEPSVVAIGPPSTDAVRIVDPDAVELYADVLWLGGCLGRVEGLLAEAERDARELDRLGLASARQGVDAHLRDVTLGLCLRPPTSASEATDHAALLDALKPAARARPPVMAIIEAVLEIDEAAWGGRVSGTA